MAALLFARRTAPALGLIGTATILETQQKKENGQHINRLSKPSCEAPRDWLDSPVSVSKDLLSRPTSRLGTRNDTVMLTSSKLFGISKTSCEAASLDLKGNAEPEVVQETTALSSIPLYGIPEWKKQLSVPELRSHPYLEREDIVIKNPSFFGKLFRGDHVSEITLIGCHHGSKYSAESVKKLLESVDPDIVFVELCLERANYFDLPVDMANEPFDLIGNIKYAREQERNSLKAIFERVYAVYVQRLVARHGSGFAGEFRAAAEFVKSKPENNRPLLVLGDLPSSFLTERLNHLTTSPISNDKFAGEMLRIEDLYGCKAPRGLSINDEFEDQGYELREKAWEEEETWAGYFVRTFSFLDNQNLSAVEENQRKFHYPIGTEGRVVTQERDVHMVCKLLQFCRIVKPKRVVVIIGGAHLPGMRHLLNAGVIGSTRMPEEVVEELISSTKSLAESEVPLVRDWPYALSFYNVETKVPVTFARGVAYSPAHVANELEEQK